MNTSQSILLELAPRWTSFSTRLQLPNSEKIWEAITSLYTTPDRHYHNISHLADCLDKLRSWPTIPAPINSDAIQLSLWFHDIIYDSQRSDNELASAALLSHYIRGHALEPDCVALILATQHKETSGMPAEEIICDIDLSILGAPAQTYLAYADQIQQEYQWVAPPIYREKRLEVLQNFLDRENIFHTAHARHLWQHQAIINLKQEIQILTHQHHDHH